MQLLTPALIQFSGGCCISRCSKSLSVIHKIGFGFRGTGGEVRFIVLEQWEKIFEPSDEYDLIASRCTLGNERGRKMNQTGCDIHYLAARWREGPVYCEREREESK